MKRALFVCVAALALALSAPAAQADLICGDLVNITGEAGPEFGGTIWGAGAPVGTGDNGSPHPFCGTSVYPDPFFPSASVIVTSGVLPPPQGKKFAGFIQVDFAPFFPGDFTTHFFDILGVKDPGGENFINSVTLIGSGVAATDGYNISWDGTGAALAQNPIVRIEWTQVPEPATLSLLALGALAMIRRRR